LTAGAGAGNGAKITGVCTALKPDEFKSEFFMFIGFKKITP
jgi:hypothetical protein